MADSTPSKEIEIPENVGPEEVAREILRHQTFWIVSHVRPDGDCLGSMLGLSMGLEKLGKDVTAYNADPVGEKWDFLDGIGRVTHHLPKEAPGATIFVDCGGVRRVSPDFQPKGLVINIDHHLTNERYGDLNYIDISACAVGEQIYHLLKTLGVELDLAMASAIYTSMMTDTGGFRYSNATPRAFHIAGELAEMGVDIAGIAQQVYETRSRGEVELSAIVYSRLQFELDGVMTWSELRKPDYEAHGGYESEPEGMSSEIRAIQGVEISCLLNETEEGELRAGFRGKGNIDCSAIAAECGGGGHFNASGTMIRGVPYDKAKEKVLATLRRHVEAWMNQRE